MATCTRTIQQAAQRALDCQDGVNLSGILKTFQEIVFEVLWPIARDTNQGTAWVNTHPICTMFLYKLSALNGMDRTLEREYTQAEIACMDLARTKTEPIAA